MTHRQKLLLALSILISAVFLIVAFRGLNPASVIDTLRGANWLMIVLAAGLYLPAMVLITRRWKFVLDDTVPVPVRGLFPLVAIGYMGNNIYPFRAGEVLRLALLRQGWRVPVVRGAATILVERCFDGLVMLTFLLVPAVFIDLQSELIGQVAAVAAPAFIGAMVVFLALAQRPDAFRRLVKSVTDRLPKAIGGKLAAIANDIIDGLSALRRPRDLFGVVVFSYGSWMVEAVVYLLVAVAVGLPANYLLILMVLGAVNLGGLIPASPGGVGVFEFLASTVLIAAGVPAEQALAYALLVHIVIWLPPTVIGLLMLPQMGLRLSAVARARELADANG
jgi:hypothetical protein